MGAFKSIKELPAEEYFVSGHRLCPGCSEAIVARLATKVSGKDSIFVTPTGCLEIASTSFPDTAWKVPWIHVAFENAAAVASGIESAIKVLKRKRMIPTNRKTSVVAIAGDGGTVDIGFQALSGALERGHDFLYICLDNQAYMNTGIQRSGSTPAHAWTTTTPVGKVIKGKREQEKDVVSIVATHKIPYVATGAVSYPLDLANKIRKAIDVDGPAYIHILCPCPSGWRFDPSLTIEVSRLAVQTGMWILYEMERGHFTITVKVPRRKPIKEYLKLQGRFRHLNEEDIWRIQTIADERAAELNRIVGEEAIGPVT